MPGPLAELIEPACRPGDLWNAVRRLKREPAERAVIRIGGRASAQTFGVRSVFRRSYDRPTSMRKLIAGNTVPLDDSSGLVLARYAVEH